MSVAPARILIVDDEPQIRRVLRTSLTTQGYIGLRRPQRRRGPAEDPRGAF